MHVFSNVYSVFVLFLWTPYVQCYFGTNCNIEFPNDTFPKIHFSCYLRIKIMFKLINYVMYTQNIAELKYKA